MSCQRGSVRAVSSFESGYVTYRCYVHCPEFEFDQLLPDTSLHAEHTTGEMTDTDDALEENKGPKGAVKRSKQPRVKTAVRLLHCDIIGDEFWVARPHVLADLPDAI